MERPEQQHSGRIGLGLVLVSMVLGLVLAGSACLAQMAPPKQPSLSQAAQQVTVSPVIRPTPTTAWPSLAATPVSTPTVAPVATVPATPTPAPLATHAGGSALYPPAPSNTPPATQPSMPPRPSAMQPSVVTQPALGTPTVTTVPNPGVTVHVLDGRTVRIPDARGRLVIVLSLTTAGCATCVEQVRVLLQAAAQRPDLVALALDIDPGDTPQDIAAFRDALGGNAILWALDDTGAVARQLGLRALNQMVIVTPNGQTAYHGPAPTDLAQLQQLIRRSSVQTGGCC